MGDGLRYNVLDILPVTLAGGVCSLAIIFWVVLLACRYFNKRGHRFDIDSRLHRFVRYFYSDLKVDKNKVDKNKVDKNKVDKNKEEKTVLEHGGDTYEVPPIFIYQLLLYSFVVLALSVQVFISSYLFIKSYGCSTEPYIHCFEAKAHFLVIGDEELDCKDGEALKNITSIICYDVTLNVRIAVIEGGAVIVSGWAYFKSITWLLLTLKSWWEMTNSECIKRGRFVVVLLIQLAIMVIGFGIVFARIVTLVSDEDTVYEDFIYLFLNTYVVIIGGIVPWWKFEIVKASNVLSTGCIGRGRTRTM